MDLIANISYRDFVVKVMLLSIAIPYPKNPIRSQFNKLFGDITNGVQKDYNGNKIPFMLNDVNSDFKQMMLRFLPFSAHKFTDKTLPTDNGMCTVLNMNDRVNIFSQEGKDNFLFRMANKFSPEGPQGDLTYDFNEHDSKSSYATKERESIKGTGPNRALIMDLLGPSHSQTVDIASEYKRFTVSFTFVHFIQM